MNRQEIKKEAREKIKGNIWNILWPILVISFVSGLITGLFGGRVDISDLEHVSIPTSYYIISGITAILSGLLGSCYIKYLIHFVRTGEFDRNLILSTLKEKWLDLLIATVLVAIIVSVCSMLFVIPGIIMALAYSFVDYLIVDTDVTGSEALTRSREMMKGYKGDYFVFGLSFILWFLLVGVTFGIASIYVIPYVTVACTIYYDKLKEIKKIK